MGTFFYILSVIGSRLESEKHTHLPSSSVRLVDPFCGTQK